MTEYALPKPFPGNEVFTPQAQVVLTTVIDTCEALQPDPRVLDFFRTAGGLDESGDTGPDQDSITLVQGIVRLQAIAHIARTAADLLGKELGDEGLVEISMGDDGVPDFADIPQRTFEFFQRQESSE